MTRQQAIWAKCKECIYDPEEQGTSRRQAEQCEIKDCALWSYRPKPYMRSVVDIQVLQSENENNRPNPL